jgi:hypothetical protein
MCPKLTQAHSPPAESWECIDALKGANMKYHKTSTFFTAAVLSMGALAFVGCNKEEAGNNNNPTTNPTPGQKVGNAVDNTTRAVENAATQASAAISPTGANTLEGARKAVEGVTENALTRNNFKDVASYFAKQDEDRVVKTKPDTKDLDDQVDAFNKAWKAKYGYSFKIKDLNADYPDTFIHFEQDSADSKKATGIIATSHGAPEVTIPFVQEGGRWKIHIPDTVDGQVLHDNLLTAVTTLNQNAPTWPDSDVEATQSVTHNIMSAVMNQK